MYLAGVAILLGWVTVYSSMAVLIGDAALWGSATRLMAPRVERALETRLGSAYLRDWDAVPQEERTDCAKPQRP